MVQRPVPTAGLQTVGFKGGDYRSRDPEVETLFNDQKNEFGITVDALSWIPERANANLVNNYRRGLLTHRISLRGIWRSSMKAPSPSDLMAAGSIFKCVRALTPARGLRSDGTLLGRDPRPVGWQALCP